MRRTALVTCFCALAVPGAARADAPVPVPDLAAELDSCATGVDSAERSATFSASMPAVDGASVLAMRFDLERRRGDGWKPVPATTFGRWERSVPGAAGFVYDKRIERLPAPATYRATVSFRWYDADGHVVREARRRTASCHQPERRPDLEPVRITPRTVRADGTTTYDVLVRNPGVSAAQPFRVALAVAGTALTPQVVPGLDAGRSATLSFTGRPCHPGDALRLTVDGGTNVAEADEADNVLVQRCVAP